MPDINELREKFKQMREAVESRLPDIVATLALTAKAFAERNIKDMGFGPNYSSVKYPAWFLHGKELNAAGRTFLAQRGVNSAGVQGATKKKRRKSKGDPDPGYFDKLTNWGEFREAQGLQSEHVDLSYSNRMFSNIQIVRFETEGTIYKAILGGTNEEDQNKMNWNRDRYGNFINKALTEENKNAMGELVITEISKVIDQYKP